MLCGEWIALGRHLHIGVESRHELDQRTFPALSRMNVRRMIVPAVESRLFQIHPVAALLLFRSMAAEAILFENGPNILGKIHRPRRWFRKLRAFRRWLGRPGQRAKTHETSPPRRTHSLVDGDWEIHASIVVRVHNLNNHATTGCRRVASVRFLCLAPVTWENAKNGAHANATFPALIFARFVRISPDCHGHFLALAALILSVRGFVFRRR